MNEELPTVVSTAEIQIGSVTMRVHHLSNNQRVIDAESMEAFFAGMADDTLLLTPEDNMKLAKAVIG